MGNFYEGCSPPSSLYTIPVSVALPSQSPAAPHSCRASWPCFWSCKAALGSKLWSRGFFLSHPCSFWRRDELDNLLGSFTAVLGGAAAPWNLGLYFPLHSLAITITPCSGEGCQISPSSSSPFIVIIKWLGSQLGQKSFKSRSLRICRYPFSFSLDVNASQPFDIPHSLCDW